MQRISRAYGLKQFTRFTRFAFSHSRMIGPSRMATGIKFMTAAAVPVLVTSIDKKSSSTSAITEKKYRDDVIDFIENENWEQILLNFDSDEKKFRETLRCLKYGKNIPDIKELVDMADLNRLLTDILSRDDPKKQLKWLTILNEELGLDNVKDLIDIFHGPTTIKKGTYSYSDLDKSVINYMISSLKNQESRVKFLRRMQQFSPSDEAFKLIQKCHSEYGFKIVTLNYSNYARRYDYFEYLANHDLIDPSHVVEYMDIALSSDHNTPRNKRAIANYLVTLNPHPSVKKIMTFNLIQSIQYQSDKKKKRFISNIIKLVNYEFTSEDSELLRKNINDSYGKLKMEDSRTEAVNFIKYLEQNHPNLGVVGNKS